MTSPVEVALLALCELDVLAARLDALDPDIPLVVTPQQRAENRLAVVRRALTQPSPTIKGDAVEYQNLTVEEQLAEIDQRIKPLELEHLRCSLDVDQAGKRGNPQQKARCDEIEQTIVVLRDREAKLKAKK